MTIKKIDQGSSSAVIRQVWESTSAEELTAEQQRQIGLYHPCGYGTQCSAIYRYSDGRFWCRFQRYTSCD